MGSQQTRSNFALGLLLARSGRLAGSLLNCFQFILERGNFDEYVVAGPLTLHSYVIGSSGADWTDWFVSIYMWVCAESDGWQSLWKVSDVEWLLCWAALILQVLCMDSSRLWSLIWCFFSLGRSIQNLSSGFNRCGFTWCLCTAYDSQSFHTCNKLVLLWPCEFSKHL